MANPDQLEEIEVLKSIYDGDEAFKFVDDPQNCTVIQYFFGKMNEPKSFLVEFRWPSEYPSSAVLETNLDLFYNKHLVTEVKEKILRRVNDEAQNMLGSPMTYTIIEYIKENLEDLLTDQPLTLVANDSATSDTTNESIPMKSTVEKKEQLSKAQKRKMWDRGEGTGEKERGWNWVDVVKHLSQTGGEN